MVISMKEVIAIIGGGPGGLMCAYQISRNYKDKKIVIFEKKALGNRIRVSGNGRCNFSNLHNSATHYNDPQFVQEVLDDFLTHREQIYRDLGLYYHYDSEGRGYPLTNSALTVLNILKRAIKDKVMIVDDEISEVEENRHYVLKGKKQNYEADILILAYGNIAYGNDINSFYHLSESLNLALTPLRSSLCPIKCDGNFKKLEGKRVKVTATLIKGQSRIVKEQGEVLFKKDGLSGICIFNLSSFIAHDYQNLGSYTISLDLVPSLNNDDLNQLLKNSKDVLFDLQKILLDEVAKEVYSRYTKMKNKIALSDLIKDFRYKVLALYPYQDSQVISGGIALDTIDPHTLKIKNHHRLYALGEVLDVDGVSGGYNIEWAFASAYRVSKLL